MTVNEEIGLLIKELGDRWKVESDTIRASSQEKAQLIIDLEAKLKTETQELAAISENRFH